MKNTSISFRVFMVPPKTTSQTKRLAMIGGKPRFFHKKKHIESELDLMSLMAIHVPHSPFVGPITLSIKFVSPWRKIESKRNRALGLIPNDKRPDCDNMAKLICDVMTKMRFYEDDSQIYDLRVKKFWGEDVGIHITISKLIDPLSSNEL